MDKKFIITGKNASGKQYTSNLLMDVLKFNQVKVESQLDLESKDEIRSADIILCSIEYIKDVLDILCQYEVDVLYTYVSDNIIRKRLSKHIDTKAIDTIIDMDNKRYSIYDEYITKTYDISDSDDNCSMVYKIPREIIFQ